MDEQAIGVIGWIVLGVGGLVGAIALTGGIMYAADTTVGANVTGTQCSGASNPGGGGGIGGIFPQAKDSMVTVTTKFPVPGIEHTITEFDDDTCFILQGLRQGGEDPYAEYSIRSGHTVLWKSEEKQECLYDSESNSPFSC